jgi:hypothetical protein
MQAAEMQVLQPSELYQIDNETLNLLIESSPFMLEWSRTKCKHKEVGGMEEWAKTHKGEQAPIACDWYHGTWQFLRLLNMVAVPPWYEFYNEALSGILLKKPDANVLISACADYGMLATLHQAIKTADANPTIQIYDICATPLASCEWYAQRNGLKIQCFCDNIITSPSMPLGAFDLIVTDEFLTVLKKEYKPQITERWFDLLAPGGSVVTTAMLGEITTPERRKGYADRARLLVETNGTALRATKVPVKDLLAQFDTFAQVHTRHMLVDEQEIRGLFSKFELEFLKVIPTPGECVNPTNSYQIVATRPAK